MISESNNTSVNMHPALINNQFSLNRVFVFHEGRGVIEKDNQVLFLTSLERNLLAIFIRSAGFILSRRQIIDRLYDDGRELFERTIDSHVKKLRQKIAILLKGQKVIHSIYGAGYRFEWP